MLSARKCQTPRHSSLGGGSLDSGAGGRATKLHLALRVFFHDYLLTFLYVHWLLHCIEKCRIAYDKQHWWSAIALILAPAGTAQVCKLGIKCILWLRVVIDS